MIIGIGVDIVEIDRIREALDQHGERFLERVFSPDEVAQARASAPELPHLAAKYAAKEALVKALGSGLGGGITLRDVEILDDDSGRSVPYVRGAALETAERADVARFHLSVTRSESYAVAFALAESLETAAEAPGIESVEVELEPEEPAVEEPAAPPTPTELSDEELLEAADAGWDSKDSPWSVETPSPAPRTAPASPPPERGREPRRGDRRRGRSDSSGGRRGPRGSFSGRSRSDGPRDGSGRDRGSRDGSGRDDGPREGYGREEGPRDRGARDGGNRNAGGRDGGGRDRSSRRSAPSGESGGGRPRGAAKVSPEVNVEDFFMHGGFQLPRRESSPEAETGAGESGDGNGERRRRRRPRRGADRS